MNAVEQMIAAYRQTHSIR